jgi:hypothetical protein
MAITARSTMAAWSKRNGRRAGDQMAIALVT